MSSISSVRNIISKRCLYNHSTQQWRFYPHQFTNTKIPKRSPSSLSHSFSTFTPKSKVGFIEWYLGKLNSRPILTKTITTSLIFAAADFTAQMLSSSSSFDLIRTTRMAAYGLVLLGPSQHIWFNLMSKAFPKRDVFSTLKKTFMGQALYGPANASVFFSYNAALQGESGDEIAARLKRDVLPTLRNGLMYWPICDFFTYKFVPVHLQPLVNSTCSFFWTIYLTYMASLQKVGTTSIL
ncbi:protein SYM1 [Ricinus communis]|uniref:Protein SYM1, putative n=1 Tax=Ricinus communis TaxID=3988 RepID=B9S2Q7_RICCO|nr:protein SYM1 [Ricinus communis]EEF42062.1 Protein SYM1, putative [Ricinus communis]|eukprot:XP_002520276.1 protein SYM1 [Ricinus communis]